MAGDGYGPAPGVPLEDVLWRVQGKIDGGGGVSVVAYVNRTIVARLLDEWVGTSLNWRDLYEPAGKPGVMWCHLEIRHHERHDEWVRHTDIGTASDQEAEKGLVSDAFKRVAMGKWGIARNVYDLPVLRLQKNEFREFKGKAYLNAQSAVAIERMLRARGFDDAADRTRVDVDTRDDNPPAATRPATVRDTPAPAAPATEERAVSDDAPPEHDLLLAELDDLLSEADRVSAVYDRDKLASFAQESADNARKAIAKMNGRIEDAKRAAAAPEPAQEALV